MRRLCRAALVVGSLGALPAIADDAQDIRLRFEPGKTGTTQQGEIAGYGTINYLLAAEAGQTLGVTFTPDNLSAYFNIYAPGEGPGGEAIYVGSVSGNSFSGPLPASGDYTVQIYLMRNAARRSEVAHFEIDFSIE